MMFEILSDFIEKECQPEERIEWYGEYGHKIGDKYVRDEMQRLYDWWHLVYNKAYSEEDAKLWEEARKHMPDKEWVPLDSGNYLWEQHWHNKEEEQLYKQSVDAAIKLEARKEQELQENLHTLVTLIPYMWT
jgi:hypothetical protein